MAIAYLSLKGPNTKFKVKEENLGQPKVLIDQKKHLSEDFIWSIHFEVLMRSTNKILNLIKRNVSLKVKTVVKLGLCKSLILSVLMYGFTKVTSTRKETQALG